MLLHIVRLPLFGQCLIKAALKSLCGYGVLFNLPSSIKYIYRTALWLSSIRVYLDPDGKV